MISPQVGRAMFRIAFYLMIVSAGILLFTERNSAEFVITTITLIIGLIFSLLIIFVVRRESK